MFHIYNEFLDAAAGSQFKKMVEAGAELMAHETNWLQSWIQGISSPSIKAHQDAVADELAAARLRRFYPEVDEVDTAGLKVLLVCIFTATSVECVAWFGIAYIAEMARFLRQMAIAKATGWERLLIWSASSALVTYKLRITLDVFLASIGPAMCKKFTLADLKDQTKVVQERLAWIILPSK